MSAIGAVGQAVGGMQSSMRRLESAAVKISQGDVSPQVLASLIEEPIIYAANAQVLRAYDSAVGSLFSAQA